MWRLKNIEICNFKFFHDKFNLDLDGANLLLLGENGSGKSSIYWSCYTHLQANTKAQAEAQKYFTPGHGENLRNRYSDPSDPSYIKLTFTDGNAGEIAITDSDSNYLAPGSNHYDFMRKTMRCSDFLNYKILSSLFDFPNSKPNEVFDIFLRDILPFVDFKNSLPLKYDPTQQMRYMDQWWRCIVEAKHSLRLGSRSRSPIQSEVSYKEYQAFIDEFNKHMRYFLSFVVARANNIIKDDFHINAEIDADYTGASFNHKVPGTKRSYDNKLYRPSLILNAKLTDKGLANTQVSHPRSYFNEAKITCMSLALRLAILDRHAKRLADAASIVFIDDLLISLDMGVRRKVVPILLDIIKDYQAIILTHDRAFYHIVAEEIEIMDVDKQWKMYELFALDDGIAPKPALKQYLSHIQQARYHLAHLNYGAAINCARKEAEKQLKRLLPFNKRFTINEIDETIKVESLAGLIKAFKKYKQATGLNTLAPHINSARQALMNPFSHDDVDTPAYRQEVEFLINELEELALISKNDIIKSSDINVTTYKCELDSGTSIICVKVLFLEHWHKLNYKGMDYVDNPMVRVINQSTRIVSNKATLDIKTLYELMIKQAGLSHATAPLIQDAFVIGS